VYVWCTVRNSKCLSSLSYRSIYQTQYAPLNPCRVLVVSTAAERWVSNFFFLRFMVLIWLVLVCVRACERLCVAICSLIAFAIYFSITQTARTPVTIIAPHRPAYRHITCTTHGHKVVCLTLYDVYCLPDVTKSSNFLFCTFVEIKTGRREGMLQRSSKILRLGTTTVTPNLGHAYPRGTNQVL
jgi:hypothetical protein